MSSRVTELLVSAGEMIAAVGRVDHVFTTCKRDSAVNAGTDCLACDIIQAVNAIRAGQRVFSKEDERGE